MVIYLLIATMVGYMGSMEVPIDHHVLIERYSTEGACKTAIPGALDALKKHELPEYRKQVSRARCYPVWPFET